MRAQRFAVFISLVLLATIVAPVTAQQQPPAAAGNRYIVVLRDSVSRPADVAAEMGRQHGLELGFVYQHAFKGFAATVPAGRLAALQRDPRVAWVEADRLFTINTDPAYETGVDRIESDRNTTRGAGGPNGATNAVIAVLDTGVSHSDINVVKRFDCSGGSPLRSSCTEGSGQDGNGHGTHVAGTAAAKKNGTGVIGVAPGAPVWSIKVLSDSGSGYTSWIAAGIDLTAANSAAVAVANMSLGGSGSDDGNCGNSNNDAMHRAICGAVNNGVVYVVAAGNSSDDAANHVPAAYDEVITVSAVADFNGLGGGGAAATCRSDVDDTFADFSNFGADVDIAAPGVCITSTWNDGGLNTISGTSMASPHLAGVAAMYIARNGKPTTKTGALAVRNALVSAGYPQSDSACGFSGDPDSFAEPLVNADALNVGGTGATCTSASGSGDTTPPAAPTNLGASAGDASVTLNWDDNTETDLGGYNVYRSTTTGGGHGKINGTTLVGNSAYTDSTASNDVTYFYVVTAVDTTGNESAFSNEASATPASSGGGSSTMTIANMVGSSTSQGSRWSAFVTISIADSNGVGVSGASVFGTWTYNGSSDGCTTVSSGQCTVDLTGIPKRVGSVTFTVSSVADGGAHAWDSVTQSETVFKP